MLEWIFRRVSTVLADGLGRRDADNATSPLIAPLQGGGQLIVGNQVFADAATNLSRASTGSLGDPNSIDLPPTAARGADQFAAQGGWTQGSR